jgi:hypothetical protein
MNEHESFSNSIYDEQAHLAERELSAFIIAVTERFGPEQARASTQDWLDEAEIIHSAPRSTSRGWRSVTIAASARLAGRIDAAQYRQDSVAALSDTKVSPIPSSNCLSSVFLF